VLWLYDRGVKEIGRSLRREAEAAGVDPARLLFAQHLPGDEYLARYRMADLFLDTFVYNAGGTAIGALQAGLPVLTKPGDTYLSRMGAGVATAAGLPEMICATTKDYEERAVELATHPDKLASLREKLAATTPQSPLFDMPRFVSHLEEAFRCMWAQYEAGAEPKDIHILASHTS
jgi:predicted O-linked N-acetylglucosamine transferase (SPINDLY family)